ncbi:MAG TPA: NAD(P)H-dependent glycerol-3-phosphate dehydrogenase [Thermoanaerobaculia bacterium]|nr:NAD(P)H-dependent glycerol-3-phosphate dehydrogenase [Thermoanaerobaculia bacterium]
MKLSIVGAGTFGTAMAMIAARCGHEVLLWAHDPEVAEGIEKRRSNPSYLAGLPLDRNIHATHSLAQAASFSDTVFMIVPSHHYRRVLSELEAHLQSPVNVLSGTKGIENDTLERMSQITADVLGDSLRAFAVLSGPTFALETARGDPTAAVVASSDADFSQQMQRALSCRTLRLYHANDVVGVELAGSLKNVIAIAAGVVEGLGLGFNTNAALITRGLYEISKLGIALGGRPETFAGLAGMGDLVLTCTGSLSRNRSVGVALGQGKKLNEILDDAKFVAEGVKTAKAAKQLADRHSIDMPITAEMYRVLYEEEPPAKAILRLMSRSLKAESIQ